MARINGVIVGEDGVGKTSLLYALVGKPIPKDHLPTLMETYCLELDCVDDGGKHQTVELVLTDTPGNDDYHKITQMALTKKDIVLLCFSIVDAASYDKITDKWIKEINTESPQAPVILIATKCDLRNDDQNAVSTSAGKVKAEEIKAVEYIECCVWNETQIPQIKETLTKILSEQVLKKKVKGSNCCLM